MATITRRISRSLAVTAALALAITIAPAGAAQAKEKDCGWSGNVIPLMEKADRRVKSAAVTERVKERFGDDVRILSYTRMEVDLLARAGATTKPTSAATLTVNHVTYNLQVSVKGTESTASAQVRFDGLCYRTTVVVDAPWVGSTGTSKPLKVSANMALRLAQAYRLKHSTDYPLDQPLVSMNLMQATTAPPDFGKLRWYVNYDNGAGGVSVLAVYMDRTVSPTG